MNICIEYNFRLFICLMAKWSSKCILCVQTRVKYWTDSCISAYHYYILEPYCPTQYRLKWTGEWYTCTHTNMDGITESQRPNSETSKLFSIVYRPCWYGWFYGFKKCAMKCGRKLAGATRQLFVVFHSGFSIHDFALCNIMSVHTISTS